LQVGEGDQVSLCAQLDCGREQLGDFRLPEAMSALHIERGIEEVEDQILPLAKRMPAETVLAIVGAEALRTQLRGDLPLIEQIEAAYQSQARLAMSGRAVSLAVEPMHCLLLLREIAHHWPLRELRWSSESAS
jgi:hypothetical protein